MRYVAFQTAGQMGLGVLDGHELRGRLASDAAYPGDLAHLIEQGGDALAAAGKALKQAPVIDLAGITYLPPLPAPGKIICIGLNYADHSAESGFKTPTYPAVFARFASSLIGHGAPIIRPRVSSQLDYEGEFVAIIGKGGRDIAKGAALDHVMGYSLFNDVSVRDYQFKGAQWTMGKNFDGTGPFGPTLVTADEVPPGCAGLRLQTRLNGAIVQDASTDDLVFDIATLIVELSCGFTLSPGDIIVSGTPGGVGLARKPPLWMKANDICEIEMEGLGILSNPIVDQA